MGPAVLGPLPDGLAFAVVPEDDAVRIADAWPRVTAGAPNVPVHAGIGAAAHGTGGARAGTPDGGAALNGAPAEAGYVLASASTTAPGDSAPPSPAWRRC
ncbi:hypothetical protein [Streptomyces sp. NPDC057616]|uniref:hypothetical protein n=1 Tax=Streptomyces sp. NPDC057616 TaxID=3346183 RepID=UPI0036C7015E